jgi:hypothetical protein
MTDTTNKTNQRQVTLWVAHDGKMHSTVATKQANRYKIERFARGFASGHAWGFATLLPFGRGLYRETRNDALIAYRENVRDRLKALERESAELVRLYTADVLDADVDT